MVSSSATSSSLTSPRNLRHNSAIEGGRKEIVRSYAVIYLITSSLLEHISDTFFRALLSCLQTHQVLGSRFEEAKIWVGKSATGAQLRVPSVRSDDVTDSRRALTGTISFVGPSSARPGVYNSGLHQIWLYLCS